ncbi:MAG: TolC family protein [Neisseria sp.]|uniref:TolC family protein n=1 Tax=Neisseria sp. TaxID=192066 RepID=UPI0026DBB5C9|nr:TolC family protein [Neisseria sp.]MDO4248297.1 TolC family protein [Neisseria sp.]
MQKHLFYKTTGYLKRCSALSVAVFMISQPVAAKELREILQKSLVADPSVLEAKANVASAQSATKASRAAHYPVVGFTGTQVLAQRNDDRVDDLDNAIGLKGSVNLFSWGGIEASVNRDKNKETHYKYKYYETQEELGSEIGKLYLTALRAKESIEVNQQSLNRHNKLLRDLDVVAKYDRGRRSEVIEAEARRLQVQTTIAQLTRTMELALSRLSKYLPTPLRPQDLQDPFRTETARTLVSRYKGTDNGVNPSYLAQKAERESAFYEMEVSKAARKPAINLEGIATQETKQLYLNLTWNFFDQAARHTIDKNAHTVEAADSKMDQILREVVERSKTAEMDMAQSELRSGITAQHIVSQKEVVKAYELQFKVARRTLTDVLGSYNELATIEQEYVTSRNDFRDAALEYLTAQAQVANWAGVSPEE